MKAIKHSMTKTMCLVKSYELWFLDFQKFRSFDIFGAGKENSIREIIMFFPWKFLLLQGIVGDILAIDIAIQ